MKITVRLGAVVAALVFSGPLSANTPADITPEELALLPQWCNHTQSFAGQQSNPETYNNYVNRYGRGWTHLHHFCWALIDQIRIPRTRGDQRQRDYLVARAAGNIDYVLIHSPLDFALRSEMYARKIQVFRIGNRRDLAAKAAEQWVQEQPKNPAALGALVDQLISVGDRASAQQVVERAAGLIDDPAELERLKAKLARKP